MSYPSDNFEDPPRWSKENDLPEIRWRVTQKEMRIQELGLQLELDRAIRDLGTHPGWKEIVDRLRSIEHEETQFLRSARMDSYELGRRQGMLMALQKMTHGKPMEPPDVDNAVAEIRLLQQQLVELRELLQ